MQKGSCSMVLTEKGVVFSSPLITNQCHVGDLDVVTRDPQPCGMLGINSWA